MRRGGGKQKGNQFEREVCRALSLWVSDGKEEDLFWRSAISGGRATVAKVKGKDLRRQAGDITATSAEGCSLTDRFYIECKFYKNLKIVSFIFQGKGLLADFWNETCEKAALHNKRPMLIAKQNLLDPFVLLAMDGGRLLTKKWPLPRRLAVVNSYGVEIVKLRDLVAAKYKAQ